MGVRWGVGRDHLNYLDNYISIIKFGHPIRDDMESGFILYETIFANIGAHFSILFASFAVIQSFLTFQFFRNEKYLWSYLSFVVMTGNVFFMWSNIIRSTIVISVFIYLSSLMLEKRRFWLYLLIVMLLTTIHFSAIILLPLFVLFYIDFKKFFISIKYQLVLFFGSMACANSALWMSLLDFIDIATAFFGYNRYSSDVLLNIGDRQLAFGPRRILLLLIDLIIILYSRQLRSTFTTKIFGFSLILFIIYYTFMPVFVNNMAFSRIIDYFQIGRALMASYLFFYLFRVKKTKFNYVGGLILACIFIIHIVAQIYSDNAGVDAIRYDFFWNHRL